MHLPDDSVTLHVVAGTASLLRAVIVTARCVLLVWMVALLLTQAAQPKSCI